MSVLCESVNCINCDNSFIVIIHRVYTPKFGRVYNAMAFFFCNSRNKLKVVQFGICKQLKTEVLTSKKINLKMIFNIYIYIYIGDK